MKKLFLFLCIVIMFFGITGCPPDDNNNPVTPATSNNFSKPLADTNGTPSIGGDGNTFPIAEEGGNHAAVPEPATLILLGTGLVGLAGYGRKKFKK